MDAPERIWAAGGHYWPDPTFKRDKVEYVRADAYSALETQLFCDNQRMGRIEELTAERDRFSERIDELVIAIDAATARAEAAEAKLATVESELGGFLAVWAVRYAEIQGFAPGELHPQHYARMAELGLRMVDFQPALIQEPK